MVSSPVLLRASEGMAFPFGPNNPVAPSMVERARTLQ